MVFTKGVCLTERNELVVAAQVKGDFEEGTLL